MHCNPREAAGTRFFNIPKPERGWDWIGTLEVHDASFTTIAFLIFCTGNAPVPTQTSIKVSATTKMLMTSLGKFAVDLA